MVSGIFQINSSVLNWEFSFSHRCPPDWKGEYCQTNVYNVVASSGTLDFNTRAQTQKGCKVHFCKLLTGLFVHLSVCPHPSLAVGIAIGVTVLIVALLVALVYAARSKSNLLERLRTSMPSMPSMPTMPSMPSMPSMPTFR